MSIPALSGWQRLGIVLTVLWLALVAASTGFDWMSPNVHRWINSRFVDPDDPLQLFPRVHWARLFALALFPVLGLWVLGAVATWVRNGFNAALANPMVKPGRLADVLALIQVLALVRYSHRTEEMIKVELQANPLSAGTWTTIATDHPELFRVAVDSASPISLVARHVSPPNAQGEKLLPIDYTSKLLSLAIELHDRQLRRARAWELFVPVLVALIAGTFSLLGFVLQH